MNKAILIGHLANDPEARTTQSGISQCTFRLAVQRPFTNQQGVREADFLTIVCWRQTADYAAKYLAKGDRAAVEGSIQTRSYDAQDGTKRYVTEIIADRVEGLRGRNEGQTEHAPEQVANAEINGRQVHMTEIPVEDDELPF